MVKPLFCERVLDAAAGYYPPVTTPCRPRFTQGLQLRPTPGAYRQNLIGDTGFERGIALRAIGGVFVKRFAISAALFSLILFSLAAQAQPGGDVAFGISTLSATSSNNAGSNFSPQSVGGGVFPGFSADFKLWKNLGVGGNIAWRATRNDYQGVVPFRPILYDVDAFWSPSIPKATPQLWAGIGAVSNRFYTGQLNCNFVSCTNFTSVTHFLGDFGGGLKLYAKGNFFVRPEATIYLIRNNTEFSGPWATKYGVSIGYSFGSH